MRRFLLACCALVVAFPAAAETVTLRFNSTMPNFAPVIADVLVPWMKQVESESDGAIKFQAFFAGQLIANEAKEYDALTNGIVDVDLLVPAFFLQALPDSTIFALPGAVDSAVEASYGGWKMYEAGLLRGMDRLEILATSSNDPGGLHFARNVTSLDAIKGLKIRVSGPGEAKIVEALGAAPVGMSVLTLAESLSRGLYDGSLNGWSVNHLFRVTPVLKSHFDVSLGVRQFVLAMNKSTYAKLPPSGQAALDKNRGLELSLRMGEAIGKDGEDLRAEARRKGTMVELSAADRERLATIEKPLVEAWITATPEGAEKYAFLQHELALYRKSQ